MTPSAWLAASELRIGLGCMRLPANERLAAETIAAAVESGVTVFDTARAYDGNEGLVARALRGVPGARVVTKGGMRRDGSLWIPDGRAKSILADCEASLTALDGVPIDVYLLHAPDPRTPWRTSVRALARIAGEGSVRRVGVANVTRDQLDEAIELAPVAAVQVALSLLDDRALRGGVVERCVELGLPVIAHSPLGGPRRVAGLLRRPALAAVATAHGVEPGEAALAWLLALSPNVIAIPGARRPETARSAARAASLVLGVEERSSLALAFGRAPPPSAGPRPATGAEVVILMGIPGAGKTRLAEEYAAAGYARLNRDERGGSLVGLASDLDLELAAGAKRVVLDNTYLSRASRSHVLETAQRHGARVRCVWLDTPLAQAQVNLVDRLLDVFGRLPSPEELRSLSRTRAGVLAPTSQMRAPRELEPPAVAEGFDAIERVPFVRASPGGGRPGVFVAASALAGTGWQAALASADPQAPHLVFDWRPDGSVDDLAGLAAELDAHVPGPVEAAVCPHPGGPPTCWCRPPLPGLLLAFARRHGVEPSSAVVVGTSTAQRTLAATLAARYVDCAG